MKYSDLSDFEINKLVAEALGRFEFVSDLNIEGMGSAVLCDSLRTCDEYDFCNNPSDAWSIIEFMLDEGATLAINSDGVLSSNFGAKYKGFSFDVDGEPLRSAMIVYLMMKDAENEV